MSRKDFDTEYNRVKEGLEDLGYIPENEQRIQGRAYFHAGKPDFGMHIEFGRREDE